MKALRFVPLLALAASFAWADVPTCTLTPIGNEGAYTGFDVSVGGKLLTQVRFCSNDMLIASRLRRPAAEPGALVFEGLQFKPESGAVLSRGSVAVRPGPASDPYPRIDFALALSSFDSRKWESALGGQCPLHFLTLSLDNAEAIHHRGFLVATPKLDPYTMQVGRQGIVASTWSRNWTWAPPFGACPIPVAGLWAASDRRYVAYDFMEPRLTDHSEKFVASAYCWEQGKSRNFIALVTPAAKDYVNLAYPTTPTRIETHCRLLYNLDLPSWQDPNQWYHERLWRVYADKLPGAPARNDLSWLPAYARASDWPGIPAMGLTYKVPQKDNWETNFFEPGTILPGAGPGWIVDLYYRRGMQDQIASLKEQLKYFADKAKWFEVNGEPCCYWEKPLEGKPRIRYAGDVTTLRNVSGWGIADVLLAMYEHEPNPEYLKMVDGALNWTKYNICTRNDISDVPEAMFTIGWGGTRLCLRYWRMFRDDPERAERARMALQLAHSLAYRYTSLFMPDNADDDNLDGTFLVEPNSGRPWTGMPCANECCEIPDELLRVYVETGDPILLEYVKGMVARWHLLYQEDDAESTATSDTNFTEAWGLFDGCAMGGRDKRAKYGAFGYFNLIKPIGAAAARVVCGSKGAACFNQRGMNVDISDYRATGPLPGGGMSFKVNSALAGGFELDVTAPNYEVTGVDVLRIRGGQQQHLAPGKDYVMPQSSLWDMAIRDVRDGDTIALQAYSPQAPTLDIRPVKMIQGPRDYSGQGFATVDLTKSLNWKPSLDWDNNDSYAAYPQGDRLAYGVPFFLIPSEAAGGKAGVRDGQVPLGTKAKAVALVVSEIGDGTKIEVRYRGGNTVTVPLGDAAVAWKAWPKWYTAKLSLVTCVCSGEEIASVGVKGAVLWAITTAQSQPAAQTVAAVATRVQEDRRQLAAEQKRQEEREQRLKIGSALLLTATVPKAADHCFAYVYFRQGMETIPPGAYLEYDAMAPFDSARDTVGVDLSGGTLGNLRDTVGGTHPASSLGARGQWVHRKLDLRSVAGKTFEYAVAATDGASAPGTYKAYLRDIALTDGQGKILLSLYDNSPKAPVAAPGIAPNGGILEMENATVTTVLATKVDTGQSGGGLHMRDDIAKDDFSSYPEGSVGLPTWTTTAGTWYVTNGAFVGRDCETAGWLAQGASAGDPKWKDYQLSLRFKILEHGSDWRDGPWIALRGARGQHGGYSLNFTSRTVELHKCALGRTTTDANPMASAPWQPDDQWHTVVLSVVGTRLTAMLDGKALFSATDDNTLGVPPIPAGNVILCARRWAGSEGHTTVAFGDVEIKLLQP
jgi:hypothetical protein